MTDWTTCRVVRDRAGDLWFRGCDSDDLWTANTNYPDVFLTADELHTAFGGLTPVLDADGQPVVRTVGDLTARHIGRRARIGKTPPATLMGLSWREVGIRLHLFPPDAEAAWQNLPLGTPCEVLA